MKQTKRYTAHEFIRVLEIEDFDFYVMIAIGSQVHLHSEIAPLYNMNKERYYSLFKASNYYNPPYLLSLCAANYRGIQQFSGIYLDEINHGSSRQTLRLLKKGYKFIFNYLANRRTVDIIALRDALLHHVAKNKLSSTVTSFCNFTVILYLCRLKNIAIECHPFDVKLIRSAFQLIDQPTIPLELGTSIDDFATRYPNLDAKKKSFKLPLNNLMTAINHAHAFEALKENPRLKHSPEKLTTIACSNDLLRGVNLVASLLAEHHINIIDLENITPISHDTLVHLLALSESAKNQFNTPPTRDELLGIYLMTHALIEDYNTIKANYLVHNYEENLVELNTLKATYSAKIDQLNAQEQTLLDNIATLKQQLKNSQEENTSLLKKLKQADNTVQSLQQQIKKLQQENHSLQARLTPKQEEDQPDTKTMTDYLMAHPCFLIGGHPTWQHALKQQLPTWHFVSVEDLNKNLSHLKKSDTLFFNDAYNSHAMYQKIKQTGATLHYCGNTTNIELTLKHLYEQLKNNS